MYTISGHLFVFFIPFTIHTQLHTQRLFASDAISIFYTVSLYVEVTPVILH